MNDCSAPAPAPAAFSPPVITLPPLLDRQAVERLRETILQLGVGAEWTIACKCIRIQADEVEALTTPALQLLLALARAGAAAGLRLDWASASPAVVETVRLAGAGGLLGLTGPLPEGVLPDAIAT